MRRLLLIWRLVNPDFLTTIKDNSCMKLICIAKCMTALFLAEVWDLWSLLVRAVVVRMSVRLLVFLSTKIYRVGQKTWHFTFVHTFANYWPIFNFFTDTLCGQFAITCLLHIPPHHKCVSTLPCKISIKYALIMIITNILIKF